MSALIAASPRHPMRATDAGSSDQSARDERGFSFLEVMISATLMGIAFAAIFSAMSTANLTALRNNQQVQVEAALSGAKQCLAQATFDPSHAYSTVPICAAGAVAITISAVDQPTYPGGLHAVTIQGTLSSTTRATTVYKGNR